MKRPVGFRAWLAATFALSTIGFFTAGEQAWLGVIVLGAIVAARWLLIGAPWNEDAPSARGPFPRWLLNSLSVLAVLWAFARGLTTPDQFVTSLGATIIWLQGVLWFDNVRIREEGRLLVLSLFTMVAACLTSNSLALGVLLVAYLPVSVRAALLLQIRASGAEANAPSTALTRVGAGQLRRVAGVTSVACAALSAGLFVLLPRAATGDLFGAWANPGSGAQIGFSDEVMLGREGELEGNDEPVLDLLLTDSAGRNIGSADRPVYLRGSALDEYDPTRGVWRRSASATDQSLSYALSTLIPAEFGRPRDVPLISQKITVRNRQGETLFAAARPVRVQIDRTGRLNVGRFDGVLALVRRTGRVVYTVDSVADYTPSPDADPPRQPPIFREGPVKEFADRVLRDADLARAVAERHTPDDLRIVRAFERALQSGYEYDATMTAPRAGEDPIEMFLLRTRRGHCSYFASAMAALCRAVGIDARVISGYRASEFNDLTGQYVVRQGHAHAWIEVNTSPGVWIVVDPSPVAGVSRAHRPRGGVVGALRTAKEAAEHVWITWVVGYDQNQRMSIFGAPRFDVGWLGERADRLTSLSPRQVGLRVARAGIAGVAAFVLAAGALFGGRAMARVVTARRRERRRRARILARSAPSDARLAHDIARQTRFYDRVLSRWRGAGVEKPLEVPPLRHVDRALVDRPTARSASSRLIHLYYAARFGARTLSAQELDEIDRLERSLADALSRGS